MTEKSEISRRGLIGAGLGAAAITTMAQSTGGGAPIRPRAKQPTIFATGGGWFPNAWSPSYFPEYALKLSPVRSPRICLLGPASGENANNFEAFARGWEPYDCSVHHFNIFQPATLDFVDYLMDKDIVFVGGGSTKNLMALWREWEFDKALRQAWQAGVVMTGGSAGLICWFQSGLTDSYPKVLNAVKATGFLPGSVNPHYEIRPDRKSRFRELIANGTLESPGLALDQDVGVLYHGTEIVEIVSGKKGSGAYKVVRTPTGYSETPLPVRFLGS